MVNKRCFASSMEASVVMPISALDTRKSTSGEISVQFKDVS